MKLPPPTAPENSAFRSNCFPPKTPAGETALWQNLDDLMAFEPSFVTCTYGAGGSTRDKTLQIVTEVARRYRCPVASHLNLRRRHRRSTALLSVRRHPEWHR